MGTMHSARGSTVKNTRKFPVIFRILCDRKHKKPHAMVRICGLIGGNATFIRVRQHTVLGTCEIIQEA